MRVWHDFPVGGLDFCLLGGLRVLLGDQALELTAPKPRLAMAVLLLERDRVVPSNRLVDLLWRDDDTAGVSALQVYVSRLRTMLEPDRPPRSPSTVLVSQPPGYRLTVPREALDIHRFEDAVATGRTAARSGDAELGRRRLDEALALWTGPLLPEFSDEPFVRTDAERLGELRLSALEAAGEIRLELGDDAGAHTVLASVAAEHPMREHLNGLVALAEYGWVAKPTPCARSTAAAGRWPKPPDSNPDANSANSKPTCSTTHRRCSRRRRRLRIGQ